MWTVSAGLIVATVVLAGLSSTSTPTSRDDAHRTFSSVLLGLASNLNAGCIHLLFHHEDRDKNFAFHSSRVQKTVSKQGVQTAALNIATYSKIAQRLPCTRNVALNVVVGGDISRINKALFQLAKNTHMSDYHWLLYHPVAHHPRELGDVFHHVNIPFDCQLVVASRGGAGSVVLTEVYRLAPNTSLRWDRFGSWSPEDGFRGPPDSIFTRRHHLHGITLTAATMNEPPITILIEDGTRPLRVEGFFGKMWTLLEKSMNFTTRFIKPKDESWGGQRADGTWDGMVGMLVRREAQLAVTEFSMTSLRVNVIDFTIPLINTKNCVFIKHLNTDNSRVHWAAYFAPFSRSLWITIGAFITVMTAVFFVAYKLKHRYLVCEHPHERSSFTDCLVFVYGALCQQGLDINTRISSMLSLSLVTYLSAIILHAAYSAQLISFLTVRENNLPFTNLEEMLEIGTYRLGVLANSGQLDNFNKATEPLMKQLYDRLIAPDKDDLPLSIEEGLRRVCEEEHYAFMTSLDVVLGLLKNFTCTVVAVPNASYKESLAIAVARNCPYRKLINYNLQVLRRNGVWHKLRLAEWPVKMLPPEEGYDSVSMFQVVPLASVLASGGSVALLLLLYERWSVTHRR